MMFAQMDAVPRRWVEFRRTEQSKRLRAYCATRPPAYYKRIAEVGSKFLSAIHASRTPEERSAFSRAAALKRWRKEK